MGAFKNKKFNYSPKKYKSNPLFRNKKKKKGTGANLWIKLSFLAIILALAGLAWFLFFSDFFIIQNVEISGTGNVDADEVKAKAFEQLNETKYKYLKNNNIFLFDTGRLYDKFSQSYNFEYLNIDKKYPRNIKITFKTRQQAFVWQEGGIMYFIDNKGNVINETNPADQTIKKFSVIENQSIQKITENQIENIQDILNFISDLDKALSNKKISDLKIEKFIIDNNLHAVKLKVVNGPGILFNINGSLSAQVNKLETLVKEKLKNDFIKKQYIDIRFGDMIYYQ